MDFFKIKNLRDYPLDDKDLPLDFDMEDPFADIRAEFDLDNDFGITDKDFDSIDNISPVIDKQMQDNSEEPEGSQYQDELNDNTFIDDSLDDADANPDELDDSLDNNQDNPEEQPEEDPNFQGVIRTVKGANLVYKRQNETNTYDELWIMNIGNDMKKESQTKRAILAGTDITPNGESQDGKQTMEIYSVGNIQFMLLSNLPS